VLQLVDPQSLPERLEYAGLTGAHVSRGRRSLRWRACKPAA